MKCFHCGAEIDSGLRFCPECGSGLQNQRHSPGSGADTGRASGEASAFSPASGASLPLKAVMLLLAVIYALCGVRRLFSGLAFLLRALRSIRFFSFLFTGLVMLSIAAVFLLLAAILILTALRHNEENAAPLFLCIAGGGIAILLLEALYALVRALTSASTGRYLLTFRVLPGILGAFITIGAAYGLMLAAGFRPVTDFSADGLRNTASRVMPTLNSLAESFRSSGSGAAAAGTASRGAENVGFGGPSQNTGGPFPGTAGPGMQGTSAGQRNVRFDLGSVPPPRGYTALKENRSFLLYILFSLLTCGLYSYYFLYHLAKDINTACAGDGAPQVGGLGEYIGYSILTCGVYSSCWLFNLMNRVNSNAKRYRISIEEDGTSILLWSTVGFLLCGLGPFVAMYKMCKSVNSLCAAYNRYNGLA